MRHHDEAVAGAIVRYSALPDALALVLVGSVARGEERPDSDVALYLVVTEEGYRQRLTADRLSFSEDAPEFYEHAYFDVKVMTLEQLNLAAERADDPMRASFAGSRAVWALEPLTTADVEGLLLRIVDPPEERWRSHQAAFLAQARLHASYFLVQAEERGSTLLLHHAAVHFAFALGRALLALNHVPFAGQKYLEARLETLQLAPPNLAARLAAFLGAPTAAAARQLLAETENLSEWPLTREQTLSRFVQDNEFAWLTGVIPPEYR